MPLYLPVTRGHPAQGSDSKDRLFHSVVIVVTTGPSPAGLFSIAVSGRLTVYRIKMIQHIYQALKAIE